MMNNRVPCLNLDFGRGAKNIGIAYPLSAKPPVIAKLSKNTFGIICQENSHPVGAIEPNLFTSFARHLIGGLFPSGVFRWHSLLKATVR